MMKYRLICLFVTIAAGICLAPAQNSKVRASSAKPGPDPLQAATKPLTPKSAMPSHRKSSVAVPSASTSGRNTTAELTRMERQNGKASGSKSGDKGPAKSSSVRKSTETSAGSGPEINSKYQKPVGGLKASTPGANAPNSSTPRVTKKN
jgi:hypothetical protein